MLPRAKALANKPLSLFGNGSQTWSFCYVDDFIRGLYLLATSDERLSVNLGNPHEMTLRERSETVLRVAGSSSEIVYEAPRVGDPDVGQSKITRPRELLGWEPEAELDEGSYRTIAARSPHTADLSA
jgi:dTDP-glucose 4,6-dehydratase